MLKIIVKTKIDNNKGRDRNIRNKIMNAMIFSYSLSVWSFIYGSSIATLP